MHCGAVASNLDLSMVMVAWQQEAENVLCGSKSMRFYERMAAGMKTQGGLEFGAMP